MTEPLPPEYLARAVQRPRFFDGQLLTAADLALEQQYHRDMRYLHNRALGLGVVEGLDVHPSPSGVSVSPGFAIDRLGREIVLAQTAHLRLDHNLMVPGVTLAVTATWSEELAGTTWLEAPVLGLEPAMSVAPPALVLARIRKRRRKGLLIDVSARDGFRLRALTQRSSNG